MSAENKAAVKRFYAEVFNGGDLSFVDEFMSDDFVEHEEFPGLESGREGLKQFTTMMRTAFPDWKMELHDLIAEGDKVVARLTMSGTQQGEFIGIPASGKSFNVMVIDIVRFVDGKVVEHWGASDTAKMMQQLGALPE